MGSVGFEAAVMAPAAVSPDADVSVKSTVPVLPQPAAGASGQVALSAYVSRPLPLGWMSRASSWACQEPMNSGYPRCVGGSQWRENQGSGCQSCQCNLVHFHQNGLTTGVTSVVQVVPSQYLSICPSFGSGYQSAGSDGAGQAGAPVSAVSPHKVAIHPEVGGSPGLAGRQISVLPRPLRDCS
jgi:hypothetical protein